MSFLFRYLLLAVVAIGIIAVIIFFLSRKRNTPTTFAPWEAPENNGAVADAFSRNNGFSKIFINGGAPSGNEMGTISVDGRALSLLYSDAPIEITVLTGRHHVVVEGGVYGNARIDRYIDFGPSDVWTVDMPGANDPDVIRHQMISSYEYKKALSDAGYSVTKVQL